MSREEPKHVDRAAAASQVAQYVAAAEIAALNGLPPASIGQIVEVLLRHNLTASRQQRQRDEVTTAEAARLLNVDRKTVAKYVSGGLLPSRDKAAPGSTQPRRLIPLAAVQKLKASSTATPASSTPARQKRKPTTSRPLKHLGTRATF